MRKANPRSWLLQLTCTLFSRLQSSVGLSVSLLVCSFPALAQAPPAADDHGAKSTQADSSEAKAADAEQFPEGRWSDTLSGTILDPTGTAVAGAKIKLSRADQLTREAISGDDGRFCFTNIAPGPFELAISSEGFAARATAGVLRPGESDVLPPITLALATAITEVRVGIPAIELAQEQIREQEQQRAFGFIPNFYVSYVPNAVPLTARQKFELAGKTTFDPVSFGLNGISAGIEQAADEFHGYGQGAEGYAKRYGASYADLVIGTYIGSAILPSLLKQDPRYFYKGSGSKRSRVMYAIANAVICKGDNGHWELNYSGIAGGLAAGGISNLYYPPGDRGANLVFENTLIGIGTTAGANILQEFVIRKLTPNLPNHAPADP